MIINPRNAKYKPDIHLGMSPVPGLAGKLDFALTGFFLLYEYADKKMLMNNPIIPTRKRIIPIIILILQ